MSSITYTLHMHNDSQATVTNGTVTDTLPGNVTISGALPAGLVNNGNGTLTWTVASLAAGADATVAYTVTVNAGAYNKTLTNVITPGPGGDLRYDAGPVVHDDSLHAALHAVEVVGSGVGVDGAARVTRSPTR